ncbi:MAG: amidohydrolase, partial [Porticoccaceae bacterium]|nr:amidohydrolase [Porticoccaceae bacterium]
MSKRYSSTLFIVMITFVCSASSVGMETDQLLASIKDEIPAREHGEGHYDQLIIRGAYMIDGSGAPATGPVDVVVEQNRIVEIRTVGTPGIPIDPKSRPQLIDKENFKVRE